MGAGRETHVQRTITAIDAALEEYGALRAEHSARRETIDPEERAAVERRIDQLEMSFLHYATTVINATPQSLFENAGIDGVTLSRARLLRGSENYTPAQELHHITYVAERLRELREIHQHRLISLSV